MTRATAFASALALLALAACQQPNPAQVRASLEVTDFSTAQQPLLVAEFLSAQRIGILGKSGRNGDVESWASPDGVGLSLDRGVLVRTAGMGHGLLVANAAPTKAALAGQGPRDYEKLYKHLTGDNQIRETVFNCRMTGPVAENITRVGRLVTARHWQETCSSASVSMVNDYWTAGGSDVIKARQWISAEAGFVVTEVPVGAPR